VFVGLSVCGVKCVGFKCLWSKVFVGCKCLWGLSFCCVKCLWGLSVCGVKCIGTAELSLHLQLLGS
jgi:hypothetical protein